MVKNFMKLNQTPHRVSHVYLESKTKRIFGIACLGKKLVCHTEISYYFRIILNKFFFKKSISSGQGAVQTEPNSVWNIPSLIRV